MSDVSALIAQQKRLFEAIDENQQALKEIEQSIADALYGSLIGTRVKNRQGVEFEITHCKYKWPRPKGGHHIGFVGRRVLKSEALSDNAHDLWWFDP